VSNCPFDDISPPPFRRSQSRYKRYFDRILAGKIHNGWTDDWSPIRRSRRLLIKEVRANLALPWLSQTYPEIRFIYLIRNPYAVTASRARTKGGWEEYFRHEKLIATKRKLLSPAQLSFINSQRLSPIEQYFASWCIENVGLMKLWRQSDNIHLVFYEDLVSSPQPTLTKLFAFLGDEIKPKLWLQIKQPSKTSAKRRGQLRPLYANNWRRELSDKQLAQLERPAKLFGIAELYPDGVPNKGAFEARFPT
jgi:hypothetical protein